MKDNLKNLEGAAEFFESHTSSTFIGRLAQMYMRQEPSCLVVRHLPVSGCPRPRSLSIAISGEEQAGERYSKEVAAHLAERLGSGDVLTEMGNVIRESDPSDPSFIQEEPTHTHPEVRVNDMFCNISDGAISHVTFVDDIWTRATEREKELFQKHGMIAEREGGPIWYPDFVRDHDMVSKLNKLAHSNESELAIAAVAFREAVRENVREYYLEEGDMIFFAQLKTLRGAPAYKTPMEGTERRWYQSMTYA